jgi:Spy/CpxP family protein refolding chaperone
MVMSKRARAVALLFGVFLIGGVAGSGATFAFAQRDVRGMMGREGFEQRKIHALTRHLDLSAEQQTKVEEILRRRGEERRKLMGDMQEQCGKPVAEHRAKTDEEIRALLTDAQKPKFEALLERRTRHLRGWGRGSRR